MLCGPIAWKFYLEIFNEVINKFKPLMILKTDCNNEALDRPQKGGLVLNLENKNNKIYLLEYDEEIIKKAKKKFLDLNIVQGDIRKIDFEDKFFDLVADLF